MTLARLFGRIGLQIRQGRERMPQSGRRHAAGVTAEELDSKRSFAPKRARAGACLAALALIWAAVPAALRAQGLSPSQTSSPAQSQARASAQRARPAAGCGLPLVATGRVKGVIDGRTLMLDDGREARLAAIEVAPVIAAAADGDERDRAGRAAQEALAELAFGRDVALRQAAESTDRYGRIVAFGFVAQDNSVAQDNAERSLQHELVAQGHARLAARIESQACLGELRARERDARRAALGLWADPHYSVQSAEKPADITARRGRFSVVEGEVVSVRESRGTTYINFGRRWSESFAAVILKRNASALLAAGLDPKRLKGRRVEVRGFVELRGGPRIEVARPEQIAVVAGR
jgi:endonuclease YncB( thermonuclease family)